MTPTSNLLAFIKEKATNMEKSANEWEAVYLASIKCGGRPDLNASDQWKYHNGASNTCLEIIDWIERNPVIPAKSDRECAKRIAYYFPPPVETTATAMVGIQRVETIAKEITAYRESITSECKEAMEKCEVALNDGQIITFEGVLCRANNAEMVDDALDALQTLKGKLP